ncbi:NAD-dependent epimerase/dehydratase family protein [Prochlorococcus sp. AH-736-N03]|nr:NAD-dependent epimerase/dehydratase family protein [Prochlorococcus sp. AH-736-N03]
MSILEEDLYNIKAKTSDCNFENATILLTGGGGFLGYYLVNYFCKFSDFHKIRKIIVLDAFLFGKPAWLTKLENKEILESKKFFVGRDSFTEFNKNYNFTHVIHMASIASPTFYRKYPLETIDANVWGLRDLLESLKSSPFLKSLIFMSSSEIYGDPEPSCIPTKEDYRGHVSCTGPRSCYDESKRFGETLCVYYSSIYNLNISMVRPFNNYGPGLSIKDRRLPADFANSIINNKDLELLSDGTPTRTFCYITDAIVGYLKVLANRFRGPINIGSDTGEISVQKMAKLYQDIGRELFGYTGKLTFSRSNDSQYLTDNPNRRVPDIGLARKSLNYKPTISNEEGVKRYLKFLKEDL